MTSTPCPPPRGPFQGEEPERGVLDRCGARSQQPAGAGNRSTSTLNSGCLGRPQRYTVRSAAVRVQFHGDGRDPRCIRGPSKIADSGRLGQPLAHSVTAKISASRTLRRHLCVLGMQPPTCNRRISATGPLTASSSRPPIGAVMADEELSYHSTSKGPCGKKFRFSFLPAEAVRSSLNGFGRGSLLSRSTR